MPVPEVCSQKPGLSAEWPFSIPVAMAFAAPSLSEASAVSRNDGSIGCSFRLKMDSNTYV